MIHLFSDLFYENSNTINQFDSSLAFWYLCKRDSKNSSIILSVSLPLKISVITCWMYNASFFKIFRRNKIDLHFELNFSFAKFSFRINYFIG